MKCKKKSRKVPNDVTISGRSLRLLEIGKLAPAKLPEGNLFLEKGNKKVGYSSEIFEAVYVWNLPPISTCPGKSDWCVRHCYNGDDRPQIFPIERWRNNWWWVINEPEKLLDYIVGVLNEHQGKTALRIHSSGDFFNKAYIEFWNLVANSCPKTTFWGYTRSWSKKDLLPFLNQLNSLPNVNLFASWDETMPPFPDGWRLSIVGSDFELQGQGLFNCPEQYEHKSITCADCRFCLTNKKDGVFFVLH